MSEHNKIEKTKLELTTWTRNSGYLLVATIVFFLYLYNAFLTLPKQYTVNPDEQLLLFESFVIALFVGAIFAIFAFIELSKKIQFIKDLPNLIKQMPQIPTITAVNGSVAIGGNARGTTITIFKSEPGVETEKEKPQRISNFPFAQNKSFTGRKELLRDLRVALTSGKNAVLTQTAVTGLGGVGKTQLALEYAYQHENDYRVIWWVRSEELATLVLDYANLARRLGLPEKDSQDMNALAEAIKEWLENNPDWLMIFDNSQNPHELEKYLPKRGSGHVIITSRNPNWDPIATPLEIQVFTKEESVEFLHKRTGQKDDDTANVLAEALGRLPLALEQAGAFIKETGISLKDYLKRFQSKQEEILKLGKPIAYSANILTTWSISIEAARREEPTSLDLLNLCSFLSPDQISRSFLVEGAKNLPEPLASTIKDDLKLDNVIACLKRYSLINNVTEEGFSIHRLVQFVIRNGLSEIDQKKWSSAAIALMNASPERLWFIHH